MRTKIYDRPIKALEHWWSSWSFLNVHTLQITGRNEGDGVLWLGHLNKVIEVEIDGTVEPFQVYTVSVPELDETVVTLQSVGLSEARG